MPKPTNKSRPIPWRWGIVLGALMATFVLGVWGFNLSYQRQGLSRTSFDLVYEALQLFTLESGKIDGEVNLPLQIARFLAPVSAAYAFVITICDLFSDRVKRFAIALKGGHVVVCGMGRKGSRLVEQLRAQGRTVVVIEPDEHNLHLPRSRELGCLVVTGRSDDQYTLQQASLQKAEVLIAVAGDDGVNIETAVRAHDLAQTRRHGELNCVVHIADPDLRAIFSQHKIFTDADDPFALEFFNTYEVGARIMLSQSRLFDPLTMPSDGTPHLLIIGLGLLGEAVLRRAVKDWYVEHPENDSPLRVTIIDVDATMREHWVKMRLPDLVRLCEFHFVEIDMRTLNHQVVAAEENFICGVSVAVVCLDDDAKAIYAGLTLRTLLPEQVPIVVRVSEEAGLATLLTADDEASPVIRGVSAVGLMDISCTLALVLDGTRETLAQAIHQGYVLDQLNAGVDPGKNPALLPWHHLTEDLRQSNRQQADDIRHKLKLIGCEIIGDTAVATELFEFAAAEVDQLARLEHERWLKERAAAGWSYAATKDLQKKTNPALVPWSELTDDMKGYNRESVRRIPKILAKADLAIRRIDEAVGPPSLPAFIEPRRRQLPSKNTGAA